MRDGSGQLYRRNRYLDPASGRFTQEDPIGLAGGMNLYGFGGGNPVTYSDPYGLCPFAGKTRSTSLADCPEDQSRLTAAFRIMYRSHIGRSLTDEMIKRGTTIRSTDSHPCGNEGATGCQVPGQNAIEIKVSESRLEVALSIVHEIMHRIGDETPASDMAHEYMAFGTELEFYKSLPANLRTDEFENALLSSYLKDSRATLRMLCSNYGFASCP